MNHYQTLHHIPRHPDAVRAIWLAQKLQGADPATITRTLALSEVPRRLFVLASELQAAKPGDLINVNA